MSMDTNKAKISHCISLMKKLPSNRLSINSECILFYLKLKLSCVEVNQKQRFIDRILSESRKNNRCL